MLDNQEEDAESNSTMKNDHEYEVFDPVFSEKNLWVKLKIPKHDQEMDDQMKNCSKDLKRVCKICSKSFNSGKALGGHMRIHVQQQTANKDRIFKRKVSKFEYKNQNPREESIDFVENKKRSSYCGGGLGNSSKNNVIVMKKLQTCTICGKDFPSMKSLCGHMRCHPDREWRGIQPPRSEKNSSSSSSSPLSDVVEPTKIDDRMEVLADGERNKPGFTKPLRGWSRKARRGRRATTTDTSSSEEDDGFLGAVHDLMMLAHGGQEWMNDKNDEQSYSSNDNDSDYETTNAKFVIKNKKKRKKVKLCDLELERKAFSSSPVTPAQCVKLVTSDKYKCNSCDKSFTSHQALGGHRSSHNKHKITVQIYPIAQLEETAENVKVGESSSLSESRDTCKKKLDFDLNEMPALEFEDGLVS